MAGLLIAATDHAAERYAQRVRGTLDPKGEIVARVSRAWEAGRHEPGDRGTVRVTDLRDRTLVFVCRHDVPRSELVVVTLWEEGEGARVPRRFTDALRRPMLALAVPAVLALAACGGADRLSASEYRDRAAKICADSQRASDRIEQPTRATPASIADFFRRQLEVNDDNVERFRALEPPESLQGAHDRSVKALDAAGDEVREIVKALDDGRDPAEVLSGSRDELTRLSKEQRAAAGQLGVPGCADDAGS